MAPYENKTEARGMDHCVVNIRQSRRGFSFVELMVVLGIAAGCMTWLLTLGQANSRLSAINRESMVARQLAIDLLEYYANSLGEARLESSPTPRAIDYYLSLPAFAGMFVGPDTMPLMLKMKPRILFQVEEDPEYPPGSGEYFQDLYRLSCSVTWEEARGKTKTISSFRIASMAPQ
jgi:prepilin-type N-terminal cleavage/methylation domain-containing protein